MSEERRGAARIPLEQSLEAEVGGVKVRVVELSAIGCRMEHDERFALNSPELSVAWEGARRTLPFRVVRSEIIGRSAAGLVYRSGVHFTSPSADSDAFIASLLRAVETGGADAISSTPAPQAHSTAGGRPEPSLDDSWIRKVDFLRVDADEHLKYVQFRLTPSGWVKDYVASCDQPEDGFTLPRHDPDFAEMQRTFEFADPDTRRMMQIALTSRLQAAGHS